VLVPSALKRIADAPPVRSPIEAPRSGGFSEFETRMKPPSGVR
jgi:hypothetical protein